MCLLKFEINILNSFYLLKLETKEKSYIKEKCVSIYLSIYVSLFMYAYMCPFVSMYVCMYVCWRQTI